MQSGVIQRCGYQLRKREREKVWGREREREGDSEREREREDRFFRSHYADMYIPLVWCVYDSSPYKSIIPLMHG